MQNAKCRLSRQGRRFMRQRRNHHERHVAPESPRPPRRGAGAPAAIVAAEAPARIRGRASARHDRRGRLAGRRTAATRPISPNRPRRCRARRSARRSSCSPPKGSVDLLPGRGARVGGASARERAASCSRSIAGRRAPRLRTGGGAHERSASSRTLQRKHERMVRHHAAGERQAYFRLNHEIHLAHRRGGEATRPCRRSTLR